MDGKTLSSVLLYARVLNEDGKSNAAKLPPCSKITKVYVLSSEKSHLVEAGIGTAINLSRAFLVIA